VWRLEGEVRLEERWESEALISKPQTPKHTTRTSTSNLRGASQIEGTVRARGKWANPNRRIERSIGGAQRDAGIAGMKGLRESELRVNGTRAGGPPRRRIRDRRGGAPRSRNLSNLVHLPCVRAADRQYARLAGYVGNLGGGARSPPGVFFPAAIAQCPFVSAQRVLGWSRSCRTEGGHTGRCSLRRRSANT